MTPLEFHTGIEPTEHGDQYICSCPFCEKVDKFYFNKDFLWDCKNLNCLNPETHKPRSGNLVEFLRQVYLEHDTLTKAATIVSQWRGLPVGKISQLGLKHNPWNDSIIIPTFRNGRVNNLYKAVKVVVEGKDKIQVLCTPTMEHTLMNWPEDTHETIWVCEGHWDRIAADAIIGNEPITPIGVPGAGVWKKSWTDVLVEKDVVFCYDNDNSGRVGFEKVILKHIATHPQKPRSVSFLEWPKDVPEKYDLNDTYKDSGRKSYEYLKNLIKPYTVPKGTVIVKTSIETVQANTSIDTFDKLLDIFKATYHTTPDMELCLLAVLTSIYSINVGGEQLWFRIIGPPGCGKTTIARAVAASTQVVLKSTFTGLFSGFHDGSGEDKSLVPIISGKSLIVKDADALLRQANVERIFSELRDFYDKDSSTGYRHGFNHDYRNVPSTMILCGTNVLRRSDQSFLGERFLDFELRMSKRDEELICDRMMERSMSMAADPSTLPPETPVQAAAKGFIDHLMARPMTSVLSRDLQHEIKKLAKLTAKMRTKVDRDTFGKGDITFAPVSELPTRLIGQLGKLCHCVPIVTGKMDEDINRRLLRKVVRDIIDPTSNRFRLCMDLMEGWYGRDELLEHHPQMSKSTIGRELDNLRELNIVDEKLGASNIPKFKRLMFTLSDEIKQGLMLIGNA